MIYLTSGTDKNKCRDRHHSLVKILTTKNPEASLFKVDDANFSPAQFEELIKGLTLFAGKFIIACDNVLKNANASVFIKDNLKEIANSDNIFLFLETEDVVTGWLSVEEKNKIEKRKKNIEMVAKEAIKVQKFLIPKNPDNGFNLYSIVDAFSDRDRKKTWALYQGALINNISPEEIFWKLIWQVNNMLLVKNTKDEKKMKMKPFVLNKTKRVANNFSHEELKKLSASFVGLYHTNYLGTEEFEFGLENILLEI